jgi:hypothetical protein
MDDLAFGLQVTILGMGIVFGLLTVLWLLLTLVLRLERRGARGAEARATIQGDAGRGSAGDAGRGAGGGDTGEPIDGAGLPTTVGGPAAAGSPTGAGGSPAAASPVRAGGAVAAASPASTGGPGAPGSVRLVGAPADLDPAVVAAIGVVILRHIETRRRQAAPAMRSYWPGSLLFASRWVASGRTRQSRSWTRRAR